jgi:hypothetical protein
MRYFKLLTEEGYTGDYTKGFIYSEDYSSYEGAPSVGRVVSEYPKDWEEVSEEEYLKQEGMLSDLSTCSFYDKELTLTLEEIKRSLGLKSGEYATTDNKFHNFTEGSIRLKCTPERCLDAYMTKHLVSYSDMLDGLDKGIVPSDDYIDEKLGDIINYFILQKIQLKQRNNVVLPR